jgi:hypothetical protein
MIRQSVPADTDDISRLALAQYQRTPWPLEHAFFPADVFHVCVRAGHIAACCGFARVGNTLRVMHVWGEDGFGGRRSAVELMKDLEAMADAEGLDLLFDTMSENVGLQRAVEEHSCEPFLKGDQIGYWRKARVWVEVQ